MYSSMFTSLLKCMFMYHCTLDSSAGEDEMAVGDEITKKIVSRDLEQQISNAIDARFLLQLVHHPDICHISVEVVLSLFICLFILYNLLSLFLLFTFS